MYSAKLRWKFYKFSKFVYGSVFPQKIVHFCRSTISLDMATLLSEVKEFCNTKYFLTWPWNRTEPRMIQSPSLQTFNYMTMACAHGKVCAASATAVLFQTFPLLRVYPQRSCLKKVIKNEGKLFGWFNSGLLNEHKRTHFFYSVSFSHLNGHIVLSTSCIPSKIKCSRINFS